MVPTSSRSHFSAGRVPTILARGKRAPHGSALPLLGTMTTTLLLTIAVIVLTATGPSGSLEGAAYLLS